MHYILFYEQSTPPLSTQSVSEMSIAEHPFAKLPITTAHLSARGELRNVGDPWTYPRGRRLGWHPRSWRDAFKIYDPLIRFIPPYPLVHTRFSSPDSKISASAVTVRSILSVVSLARHIFQLTNKGHVMFSYRDPVSASVARRLSTKKHARTRFVVSARSKSRHRFT